MTNKARTYLKEAKAMLADADDQERTVDDLKWEAIERIYKANAEEGVPQREIGKVVGRSHTTIGLYVRMWKRFGMVERSSRPTVTEATIEINPAASHDKAQERIAKIVLSDPERAAKVLDTVEPEAKAKVVQHVAKSDKAAMTSAMSDPKVRMRAAGASHRAQEIARAEAKNERKASGVAAPSESGAAALLKIGTLMSDGAAWAGRLSDAYEEALKVCSDDQVEALQGRVRTGSFPIVKVLGDITGEGMDDALARMLDTEGAA